MVTLNSNKITFRDDLTPDILFLEFWDWSHGWSGKWQRFGQYIMNIYSLDSCPDIFHEPCADIAYEMILEILLQP